MVLDNKILNSKSLNSKILNSIKKTYDKQKNNSIYKQE